ncbi:PHP domain-containing protein [Candidatus Woesearchaeota archaeon]|nr:PHP domain-containing protein [Candidatus Woesearchaeota archaeon]
MLKSDFHIHTSEDKKDSWIRYSAKELVKRAAELGFEVLSITNHGTFTYDQELANYARQKGVVLIPGIEAYIEGRHVVVLNPKKDIENIRNFKELKEYKKKNPDIFIMAPHMFYPVFKSVHNRFFKHHDVFDGIEYSQHYSRFFNIFNKKAAKIAKKYNKSLVGTSDSHKTYQFNKTYSLVDSEKDIISVISALKEKKIEINTMPLSVIDCIRTVQSFLWINVFRRFF